MPRFLVPTPVALAAACILAACETKTSDRDIVWVDPANALVEASRSERSTLGFKGREIVWLDPRTRKEFEAEHIEGAINIPFPELGEQTAEGLKRYGGFVVYGTDYADPIAVSASKRLLEMGFKDVSTLRGGLRAWRRDGQPVVVGDVAPAESNGG
ncbi:MAG: rhodanese-like domain-containing protein [Phycisphaerales bacterium]|jgi:rhodanese-related sulfurtransferase